MRVRNRAQRRLSCRSTEQLPADGADERRIVPRRDLHEQIVRMLAIVNLLSTTQLAGREQVRITATANCPRLDARHAAQSEAAASGAALRHNHQPVDASRLMIPAVS